MPGNLDLDDPCEETVDDELAEEAAAKDKSASETGATAPKAQADKREHGFIDHHDCDIYEHQVHQAREDVLEKVCEHDARSSRSNTSRRENIF